MHQAYSKIFIVAQSEIRGPSPRYSELGRNPKPIKSIISFAFIFEQDEAVGVYPYGLLVRKPGTSPALLGPTDPSTVNCTTNKTLFRVNCIIQTGNQLWRKTAA